MKKRNILTIPLFLLKILLFFVFIIVYVVACSIKYLLTRRSLLGRLVIFIFYASFIFLKLTSDKMFWGALNILLLLAFICAVFATWKFVREDDTAKNTSQDDFSKGTSEQNKSDERDSDRQNTQSDRNTSQKANREWDAFFDGMSFDEVKKIYRRLMKLYHPDNENGDAEMSKRITAAYQRQKDLHENH